MPTSPDISQVAYPAAAKVRAAIAEASRKADVDFGFMLANASIESSLDPAARAKTSSAAGLFQFTAGTWLATVKRHGATHGLRWAADAIAMNNGRPTVTEPAMRKAILDLRFDASLSAVMGAELTKDNAHTMQAALGRAPDTTELYFAHFLGAGNAIRFVRAHAAQPNTAAAGLFPAAAEANRAIFFPGGHGATLAEVREWFAAKLEAAGAAPSSYSTMSTRSGLPAARPVPIQIAAIERGVGSSGQQPLQPISQVLLSTFQATGPAGPPAHVRRAYSVMAAMGV